MAAVVDCGVGVGSMGVRPTGFDGAAAQALTTTSMATTATRRKRDMINLERA
jgi:hypothetical protein